MRICDKVRESAFALAITVVMAAMYNPTVVPMVYNNECAARDRYNDCMKNRIRATFNVDMGELAIPMFCDFYNIKPKDIMRSVPDKKDQQIINGIYSSPMVEPDPIEMEKPDGSYARLN